MGESGGDDDLFLFYRRLKIEKKGVEEEGMGARPNPKNAANNARRVEVGIFGKTRLDLWQTNARKNEELGANGFCQMAILSQGIVTSAVDLGQIGPNLV